LNVTVVPDAALGYLTVWPAGQSKPWVSTLNSDGRVKANASIVGAGTNGAISLYVTDRTHVVIDIGGYFVPNTSGSGLAFHPMTPCRLVDTRLNDANGLGAPYLHGGQSRSFSVRASPCDIPPEAEAYSLNFTAVPMGQLGYLTTWPTGQPQPLASTLNSYTGVVTANGSLLAAGSNGGINVFATHDTHVVIDVNGYFTSPTSGGLSLYTIEPCRVLDTRIDLSGNPLLGASTIDVPLSGCDVSRQASAYAMNATVVPNGPLGYLTLWAQSAAQPVASTLNAWDGTITSNMAIVPANNGAIAAFVSNPSHLLLDAAAYFAP